MEIELSNELKGYLENEFKSMKKNEIQLKEERKKFRQKIKHNKLKRHREKSRKIKNLEEVQRYFPNEQVNNAKNKIINEINQELIKEGTVKQNPLKGKATLDFNNFLATCYYLIRKETETTDADIYKWLESFLKESNYFMSNGMLYDTDSIKGRIRTHFKNSDIKNDLISFIEYCYQNPT
jgi:hypothetical protein